MLIVLKIIGSACVLYGILGFCFAIYYEVQKIRGCQIKSLRDFSALDFMVYKLMFKNRGEHK